MLGNSVRLRLTLWNVAVLAMVLCGFGAALSYAVQANQSAAIDRELVRRVREKAAQRSRGPSSRTDRPASAGPADGPAGAVRTSPRRGPFRGGFRFTELLPDGRWAPLPEGSQAFRPRDFRPGLDDEEGRFPRGALLFDAQGQPNPLFPYERPWDAAAVRDAARGGEQFSTVTVEGDRMRAYTAPLRRDGAVIGVLQAVQPLGEQQRLVESQFRTLLLLVPLALLVAAAGGFFLTNRALRPVSQVTQAAAQIGAEDLSRRLQVTGKDELATLAATFNEMIARLEGAFRNQAEAYRKLEAAYEEQRRFTADASHELRTPLTRILTRTSLALSGPPTVERYRKALEVADQAAQGMNRTVQDLLFLARSDAGQLPLERTTCGVRALFEAAVAAAAPAVGAPVRLDVAPGDLAVAGDPHHLGRLLVNILENARRHTPADGEIHLVAHQSEAVEGGEWRVESSDVPEPSPPRPSPIQNPKSEIQNRGTHVGRSSKISVPSTVTITVTDTGVGIRPEHLPHVCERFYRVDEARAATAGGTGLGLAICRSIAELHGGSLAVRSEPGRGTTVEVRLPGPVACPDQARVPVLA